MPVLMLQVNNASSIGVSRWEEVAKHVKPIDWLDWAKKMPQYVAQWEQEVLKKRS